MSLTDSNYSNSRAISEIALYLGSAEDWSNPADFLESIAMIIGHVRPHPGSGDHRLYPLELAIDEGARLRGTPELFTFSGKSAVRLKFPGVYSDDGLGSSCSWSVYQFDETGMEVFLGEDLVEGTFLVTLDARRVLFEGDIDGAFEFIGECVANA